MRSVIDHLNSKFSEVLSKDSEQSIDEHMVKFKGRPEMKQYIKSKLTKWSFKFWFRCLRKSGDLYQIDIYLGRIQTPEFNLGLGEEAFLQLTKDLERSFCTVYFDNFFNSPKLIEKLFQKSIYGIGAILANRKQMPKMIDDKQMKRGDCEFLFSGNTMACKWMDNQSVLLLSSILEGMNGILSVQRTEKGSKTKSLVPCPKVVKLYNSRMGGVDFMDQRTAAYRMDRRSSVRFYLCIFFDLMNIACVNSYLIYNMKHPNKFYLLDYKIVVAKIVIQYHQNRKRAIPMPRPSKRKSQPELIDNHGGHLPDYQTVQKRCAHCTMEGTENRTFVILEQYGERKCLILKFLAVGIF